MQHSSPGYVPHPGKDTPPLLSDYEARRDAAAAVRMLALSSYLTALVLGNSCHFSAENESRIIFDVVTMARMATYESSVS